MKILRFDRWLILCAAALCCSQVNAAVMLSGSTYTQDFDSLPSSGTPSWTNDSTLPGWSLFRQPAPGTAVPTIGVADGSSNSGAFNSFGASGNSERALGGVGSGGSYFGSPSSGSVAGWIAAAFTNASAASFDSFTVEYDGEQWRNGGNTNSQTTVLEYGFGNTFAAVANWVAPGPAYDFTSPTVGSSAAALDGNAAANRTADLGGTISNLTWDVGDTLWVRWAEVNDLGNDHGLAIDNFSLSTTSVSVPEPTSLVFVLVAVLSLAGVRRTLR